MQRKEHTQSEEFKTSHTTSLTCIPRIRHTIQTL